jgi:4,4'-diaponeurosporenoate glycosyltransferase
VADLALLLLLAAAAAGAHWLLRDLRMVPTGCGRPDPVASVSVVVPARDEEATLPALLESLQRSGIEVAEIVVVDDDSQDGTASLAGAAGAHVLSPGEPPPGWTGKAWACHVGARATTGAQVLFLDADTVLSPDALAGLLQLHDRYGGLVSVQPFHRVVRAYEQLSSYFNAVALLASGAFAGRPPRRPMAFGPCLLTSRSDYELAGGHAAVRGAVLDDVELAAAYDRVGLPAQCFVGGRTVRMRSYPGGVRQLGAGWTKNFASGASAADPRAALVSVGWVSAHHAVAVGALLTLAHAWTGWGALPVLGHPLLWAVAWLGVAWQLRFELRRIGSFHWWTWALFPLPLLAFDVIFLCSAGLTNGRRSVRWRGREVGLRRSTGNGV